MEKVILIFICFLIFTGCNSNQEADKSSEIDEIDEMNEKLKKQEIEIAKLKEEIANKNEILSDLERKVDNLVKSEIQIEEIYEIISDNNDMHDDRLELYNKGITNEMINLLGNLGYSYREMIELPDERIASIFAPGAHLDGYGYDITLLSEEDQKILESKGITGEEAVILNNLGYSEEEMFELTSEEIDFVIPNTELLDNLENMGFNKESINIKLESGLSYRDIIKEALYN